MGTKVSVSLEKTALEGLLRKLNIRDDVGVTVGVHMDAGEYVSGVDVATVALANEFGVVDKNIPERSFLRSAINENMDKINKWRQLAIHNLMEGKWDLEKALQYIGFNVQLLVQRKIKSNIDPPNAPSTVARKKAEGVAPRTLIETTLLLRSIEYRVFLSEAEDEDA